MNEMDLMKAAAEEPVYSNVYYGKCLLTLWEGKFPRNEEGRITGKPVRWNEGDDPKERIVMVDVLLDLCPGCSSNYPVSISCTSHDKDWVKIVLPSIKELGCTDEEGRVALWKVKDHWCKVEQVQGTRPRDKNNPDKGCWNTLKFLAIYRSEEDCLQAMALDNGEGPEIPADPVPSMLKKNSKKAQQREAALKFVEVALGTYKGMKLDEIKDALNKFIEASPTVKPYLSIDDPDVAEMINNAAIPF